MGSNSFRRIATNKTGDALLEFIPGAVLHSCSLARIEPFHEYTGMAETTFSDLKSELGGKVEEIALKIVEFG